MFAVSPCRQHSLTNHRWSGLYRERSDLGSESKPQIEFIEMPQVIRDKYQYFTEASIEKLKKTGYAGPKFTLEEGVSDYVRNYLVPHQYLES